MIKRIYLFIIYWVSAICFVRKQMSWLHTALC